MTISRRHLIDADTTPYYHIICRCVRRAFLCGQDKLTGQDFSHRRQWIVDKFAELSDVFSVDVAAYAIMNNHYHLVLHIDQTQAFSWSFNEVFERWTQLFSAIPLVQRYMDKVPLSQAELDVVYRLCEEYRQRLMSISWFMRIINESVARRANKEDNCRGRFWESRFKSQALLDSAALITCMTYVDLNPIRANMAQSPENSKFTSIQKRIKIDTKIALMPFINPNTNDANGIPFSNSAYLELVDWTGRCIREDKRGAIPYHLAPILKRIQLDEQEWLRHTRYFEARFKRMAGTFETMKRIANKLGRKWFQVNDLNNKERPT